jgi:hypothetical protein
MGGDSCFASAARLRWQLAFVLRRPGRSQRNSWPSQSVCRPWGRRSWSGSSGWRPCRCYDRRIPVLRYGRLGMRYLLRRQHGRLHITSPFGRRPRPRAPDLLSARHALGRAMPCRSPGARRCVHDCSRQVQLHEIYLVRDNDYDLVRWEEHTRLGVPLATSYGGAVCRTDSLLRRSKLTGYRGVCLSVT